MELLQKITSILSDLSGFSALLIAIWALVFKRKEIFRNHLTDKYIDELLKLRDKLNRIVYDSFYTKYWADNIKALNRSLVQFERDQPEDYSQYKTMQHGLIWLTRMISQQSFHLLPDNFDREKLTNYGKYLQENIHPYSMFKFSELSQDQVNEFQNKTIDLIKYFEEYVVKLGK